MKTQEYPIDLIHRINDGELSEEQLQTLTQSDLYPHVKRSIIAKSKSPETIELLSQECNPLYTLDILKNSCSNTQSILNALNAAIEYYESGVKIELTTLIRCVKRNRTITSAIEAKIFKIEKLIDEGDHNSRTQKVLQEVR